MTTPPTIASQWRRLESYGNLIEMPVESFEHHVEMGTNKVLYALCTKYPFRDIQPDEIRCDVTPKTPLNADLFYPEGSAKPASFDGCRLMFRYYDERIEVHYSPQFDTMQIATEEYRRYIVLPKNVKQTIGKKICAYLNLTVSEMSRIIVDQIFRNKSTTPNKQMNNLPTDSIVFTVRLIYQGRLIELKTDTEQQWVQLTEYENSTVKYDKLEYLKEVPICPPHIVTTALGYLQKKLQEVFPFKNFNLVDIHGDSFETCTIQVTKLSKKSLPSNVRETISGFKLYFSHEDKNYTVLSDEEGKKWAFPMIRVTRLPSLVLDRLREDGHQQIEITYSAKKRWLDGEMDSEIPPDSDKDTTGEEVDGFLIEFVNLDTKKSYTLKADTSHTKFLYDEKNPTSKTHDE